MKRLRWIGLALLLVAPLWAQASGGFVTANVNLRAGPDVDYPWIATIPAGSRVSIQGCTEGWGWCDVIAFGHRGWMVGDYLRYDYDNRRVLLPEYGARIGIPIVTFVIGDYWGHYYRERPFYRQRSYWYQRPIRRRPPPRPVYHPPARPRPPQQRPPKHWQSPPPSHRSPAPSYRHGQTHGSTSHREHVSQSIVPTSPQRSTGYRPAAQARAAQDVHRASPSNRDNHRPRATPAASAGRDRTERPSAHGHKAHRNHD
jgi:uncharacterized protein YraI